MSVSYASAAGSATKKELKEQTANLSSAVAAPASTKSLVSSSSESSASSMLVFTPAVTTNTDPTFGSAPEDSTNQDINKESSKSTAPVSASIDKFQSGLTPAPVPTTNPWATTSHHSSSSSSSSVVDTEPKVSQKSGQSKSPLDSVNWPKPDEGTSFLTEGSTLETPITKTRPGKEKWIPISYTPVSTKPRGGKHRGGKTNNGSNQYASTGSNGQSNTNGNSSRRGSKAQGSHSHVQAKKTDVKSPAKARSASGSTINPDSHNEFASEPTGPHTAPVVSSKDNLTKIFSSSTKGEAGASRENTSNNGHHSKHYYSNPHNFNNRNTKGHNGKVYNRRSSHYSNGNFNGGMQYYRNDYDNFPVYAPVGPIDLFSPIIFQIEYYFSSTNLCKDTYLRGLMNSNGWVPLSLLSSFYRVSRLTNGDYNLFVEACKWAPSVEVVGDKIRLRQNWENWVFPYDERLEAGKNEDSPLPVNLVFNPAESTPFIPRTEVKGSSSSSSNGKERK